jgi:ubiquitin carboxyl-terminal hydrolase 8
MNSTIQCLSATIPLSSFFLEDDRYKQYRQKNWKGSSGIMPELYTNLIRSLWKQDVEVIKPTTFRNFCGRMNREWGIDRQQDAKEFFDFLVDCLHEDLNVNWARTPLKPLTFAEEMQRERTPIAQASTYEWSRFQHRDFSYISSLFAGQHASRLRCTTCHNTSTTYETFYSISVEIPRSGQGNLQDCLRSYCQEERLSGDEVWKCPHCKREREATKQIVLTRLPQFLVIHFKRFSASKTESARKIHAPIDFPLYGLSMDHYVIPRPLPATANGMAANGYHHHHHSSPNEGHASSFDPATTAPFTYDAYGVLRHIGSSGSGGHYISLVKDPGRGCWRKYDDERTVDFEPARLKERDRMTSGEAYIVFYQRSVAR